MMPFVGALGSSARLTSLRIAGQRLVPRINRQHTLSNGRSFCAFVQRDGRNKNWPLVVPSRNSIRFASTEVSAAVASAPNTEAAVPTAVAATTPTPVDVVTPAGSTTDVITSLTDTAMSHVPAALQYGDLAALGLAGWTPAGIIRWSFEIINVATGLPWFWTIVAGSLFWKVVLVPFTIKGLRNSARLLPLQPKILQSQKEMDAIRQSGDKLALQRHALKMRKMYKDAGVSLGTSALMPLVQIPVTLGMFFGVKKMCELPIPQLLNSGLDILPNLTVADPYMALPIALCAAVNLQILVGASELNLGDRPEMGHIMNGLRLLSVAGIWFMSALPSGLLVALFTTSLATTVQSLALQRPSIRKALDIPEIPVELRGKLPSPMESVQYAIAKWRSKMDDAKAAAQPQQKRRR